jgi:7-carboxy-7-deazaguanine synthase
MHETSEQKSRLKITEIFYSLQGEARNSGLPTVFIRLTGCPLRCGYCDTDYAFSGGEWLSLEAVLEQVDRYDTKYVTVTGGEPLAQKNCIALLERLCDLDYDVSLETSGAISIAAVDERVSRVVDVKTPASDEESKNKIENFDLLTEKDQLKFVICNEADYIWSKNFIAQHNLLDRCEILFSPVQSQLDAKDLAGWILKDQLDVRFQIQLHKYLWGNLQGV